MKKVLLLTLLIVFLLPSCVGLAMLDEKQFSMYMKGINIITKGSMMITEQMLKTIGDCKEKCKTIKEKGYNKFSTVSRQLKSYQNVALKNNFRIVKILLIAPEFSDDFVSDCGMDTEMNISLLTASTLSKINESFKTSKYQEFPHVLFRDIVINEERIVKALSK